jgi:hypothetical protein
MDEQSDRVGILSPYSICTTVSPEAMAALLENGDGGAYRDTHPWLAARELFESERGQGRTLTLVFASGSPLELSHWALIDDIDVVALHRASWESRIVFSRLRAVHPIWSALDSLFLKPGDDQLRREALEPVAKHRQVLDERHVRPYAICEAPAFMFVGEQRSER